MRIYSMTATFGKLEHETLTLQPGMNLISAHNEWGKSTWCAFLIAMFYGIDTRSKSSRTILSEKERYAPWSGSPMSGSIRLNWQGRDITIQRSTRGRVPMGEFRVFETDTGLDIPEITAANCGQLLLGVERSVFLRAGFIRFSDLNVSDDDAFRRRLNNLVTSGDEDGAAERLAGELKVLRNRIRYNRTGLLPQAEAEREIQEARYLEYQQLQQRSENIQRRMDETEDWHLALENHLAALDYAEAREGIAKFSAAEQHLRAALAELDKQNALCSSLPSREAAEDALTQLQSLEQERMRLQDHIRAIRQVEDPPALDEAFRELDAAEALTKAGQDAAVYQRCRKPRYAALLPGIVVLILGLFLWWQQIPYASLCAGAGILALSLASITLVLRHRNKVRLEDHYGSGNPRQWILRAGDYGQALWLHSPEARQLRDNRQALEKQLKQLNTRIRETADGAEAEDCRNHWEAVLASWDARDAALLEYRSWQARLDLLKPLVKPAEPPAFPDRLTESRQDTRRQILSCQEERHNLENQLGQTQARMEALGSPDAMEENLRRISTRITQLEQRYRALTIALATLEEASAELQRRFSPRITRHAQELMLRMTGGRYDRLQLSRDLRIQAGAGNEDVLHESLWRSDGTVDQLYLALRLAVARELTPALPLILDDALVRFDDRRLKSALEILQEESRHKQVILFTCQSREQALLDEISPASQCEMP